MNHCSSQTQQMRATYALMSTPILFLYGGHNKKQPDIFHPVGEQLLLTSPKMNEF